LCTEKVASGKNEGKLGCEKKQDTGVGPASRKRGLAGKEALRLNSTRKKTKEK